MGINHLRRLLTQTFTDPVCDWCGRPARKMPRKGRRTYRHKCPHGHWCPRSDPYRQHDNAYPVGGQMRGPGSLPPCDQCRDARRKAK